MGDDKPKLPEHTIELLEYVLHDRLCESLQIKVDPVLDLCPGKVNISKDIMHYRVSSEGVRALTAAKRNFKQTILAIAHRWRHHGARLDLCVTLTRPPRGQRYMLASSPADHARNLDMLYRQLVRWSPLVRPSLCITSEDYDPWLVANRETWLFSAEVNAWMGEPPIYDDEATHSPSAPTVPVVV